MVCLISCHSSLDQVSRDDHQSLLTREGLDNVNDEPPPPKVMKMDPKVPEDFEMNLGQDEKEALVPVRDTYQY